MQMPNDKLSTKRVENVSRSGRNREQIDLNIDYDTTFQDIQYLRAELTKFVSSEENKRDYRPVVDVKINAIPDLQKIQLKVSFWHKSNWADEQVRSARSSKFVCRLLQIARYVPIGKPGGSKAKTGDEGKPSYMVHITEQDAATKRAAEKQRLSEKRMDYAKPVPEEKPESAPVDGTYLTEDELAELESKRQKEEEEKKKAAEKKAKDEEDKKKTALAEQEAMDYLTEIPRADNVAQWDGGDGLRNRHKY